MDNTNNASPAPTTKLTWDKCPIESHTWDAETSCGGIVTISRGQATRYYHGTRRGPTTERTSPWEWSITFTRHNETTGRGESVKLYRSIPDNTNLRKAKKIAELIISDAL